ncbi:MAG: hypothetical protein V8T36_04330 [Ruthenibacterium lactatiformans]
MASSAMWWKNGAAVRGDVKTGLSSDTQVEIASGISAGDEVNPQPAGCDGGHGCSAATPPPRRRCPRTRVWAL